MKYKTLDLVRHDTFGILLISVMTQYVQEKKLDFQETFLPGPPGEEKEFDITVTVNGHEINPKYFVESLYRAHREQIEEAAKKYLESKCQPLLNKLDNLRDVVASHVKDLVLELPQDLQEDFQREEERSLPSWL